ncbi:MAG TPA: hypothetical protein PKH71_07225 [Methanoregulaceae archaeon]|nr:hypothetical protein [Methanoregulaceae archaeon]
MVSPLRLVVPAPLIGAMLPQYLFQQIFPSWSEQSGRRPAFCRVYFFSLAGNSWFPPQGGDSAGICNKLLPLIKIT